MKYRGFSIKTIEKTFPHMVKVSGHGIFDGEKLLGYAGSADLAKHVIDVKLEQGLWVSHGAAE